MLSKLFGTNRIDIIPIKKLEKDKNDWGGEAIVFYLKNGKGILREKYGSNDTQGLFSLVYDDIPLSKFHGDEYFCPTCEKLVSAGYGLDKTNDQVIAKLRETLNQPFVSLEESLKNLELLIGLLPTGYYALAQPPRLFNKDTADFYRSNDHYRGVAYYLDGYLCALLDGHHKAVAAALEKRPLKTLVILPTTGLFFTEDEQKGNRGGLIISGEKVYEDELLSSLKKVRNSFPEKRMSEAEMENYLRLNDESFGRYNWSEDFLKTGKYFPNVFATACIEWAGDLSEARLDKIINDEEVWDSSTLYYIVRALFELNNPRFKQVAFFIGRNESYCSIWKGVYSLIAKIKNDEDVENFFVEFLINDEKVRPDITKVVDEYFRKGW